MLFVFAFSFLALISALHVEIDLINENSWKWSEYITTILSTCKLSDSETEKSVIFLLGNQVYGFPTRYMEGFITKVELYERQRDFVTLFEKLGPSCGIVLERQNFGLMNI